MPQTKSGLLFKAAEDFNIDLTKSWMIGDSETDILCGKNAGGKTAKIGEGDGADLYGDSLIDCIDKIIGD